MAGILLMGNVDFKEVRRNLNRDGLFFSLGKMMIPSYSISGMEDWDVRQRNLEELQEYPTFMLSSLDWLRCLLREAM